MRDKKGTRVEIRALTKKGSKALAIQQEDETALRYKYSKVPKWRLPLNVRNYLKTVSAFMPKEGNPSEHHILGFGKMSKVEKNTLAKGIIQSFKENGCTQDDFEVYFYDE